jgi:hypothetical protein
MGLLVIFIFAQNFAGLWVHKVSLSALFAVHRLIRAVFRFKIVVLRQLFDDDEALNLESRFGQRYMKDVICFMTLNAKPARALSPFDAIFSASLRRI